MQTHVRNIEVVNGDFSLVDLRHTEEGQHQAGFTGASATHHPNLFKGPDFKVDSLEHRLEARPVFHEHVRLCKGKEIQRKTKFF